MGYTIEDLFSIPDNITYLPNAETEYVDNIEDFESGKEQYREENYNRAIAFFENCLEDDDNRARRCTAIRFLLSSYHQAGINMSNLRAYLTRVSQTLNDDFVANYALKYAIWSYIHAEEYATMLNAYSNRRDDFDNLTDSLRNEIRIIRVQRLIADANRFYQNDSYNHRNYRREIDELKKQIADLRTHNLGDELMPQFISLNSPYPNPFNDRMSLSYDLNERM